MFNEHRSLFRNPLNSRVVRRPVGRRQHPYEPGSRSMWSHKFFCFSSMNVRTVPLSKGAKAALTAIGLGEKVISLQSTASATDLHSRIIQAFPPLASCGGYALLRCLGSTKTLEMLEPPSGGHTPISLSGVVGQSRVYIRPLQQDIPLSSVEVAEVCSVDLLYSCYVNWRGEVATFRWPKYRYCMLVTHTQCKLLGRGKKRTWYPHNTCQKNLPN